MGRLWIILSVMKALYLFDVSSHYFYEITKDIERDQTANGLIVSEEMFQCNIDDACKRVIKRKSVVRYEKQYGQLGMQSQQEAAVLLEKREDDDGIGVHLSQSGMERFATNARPKTLRARLQMWLQIPS